MRNDLNQNGIALNLSAFTMKAHLAAAISVVTQSVDRLPVLNGNRNQSTLQAISQEALICHAPFGYSLSFVCRMFRTGIFVSLKPSQIMFTQSKCQNLDNIFIGSHLKSSRVTEEKSGIQSKKCCVTIFIQDKFLMLRLVKSNTSK